MSTFGHNEPDLCGCGQKIGHRAPCLFRDEELRAPVKYDDEVTAEQVEAIARLVAPEFETGGWEVLETE